MAKITAFTHINIAPAQLQRRIGTDTIDFFYGFLDEKQRQYFHQAAYTDGHHDQNQQPSQITFNLVVLHANSDPPLCGLSDCGAFYATAVLRPPSNSVLPLRTVRAML